MKRTELKRTNGFKHPSEYAALRKTELKRSKQIKRRSKKLQAEIDQNHGYRDKVLAKNGYKCWICKLIRKHTLELDKPHPDLFYQLKELEIHHPDGRTGKRRYDIETAEVLCTWHHLYSKWSAHGGPARHKQLKEDFSADQV